jgi:type I restriction enzyme S subunit
MVVGWEEKRLGDVGVFSKGRGIRKDEAQSGKLPCVRYGELYTHHNDYIKHFNSYISEDVAAGSKALKFGDILFAGSGETKEEIGKCVAFVNNCEAYAGGDIVIFTPKQEVSSMFLGFYLNTNPIAIQKASKGQGDAIVHISATSLADIEINLPPLQEQRRIAEALSDTDALISVLEKLIDKKRAIKQGIMQELLTGKRRLDGFNGEWVENTLESLCYLITKQTGFDYTATIKPSLVNEFRYGYVPFIQNKDFQGEKINFKTDFYVPMEIATQFPKILLNEPCLLVSISGRIGNVAYFNNSELAFVGGAVGVAKFHRSEIAKWVMLYLQSPIGQKMIFANEKAGAQHNLTIEDIRNFIIPCPSIEEQISIYSILSDMDAEIDVLTTKLGKLRKIKQGMMSELLTGRIRLLEEV